MSAAPKPPIAALAVAAFGAVLGSTFPLSVILGLSDISGGLSERADDTAWIVTLYNVGQIVGLPTVMTAAAAFGRRTAMIGAGVGFALACALVAISPNLQWMMAARTVQGFFGGGLPTLMMLLVMTSLPPGRGQMEGLSAFGLATTIGGGLTAYLAAKLIALGGWTALFWVQAALAAVYALLATTVLRGERGDLGYLKVKDWPSYLLISLGLGLLALFFSEGERRFWFETWWITAALVCGLLATGFGAKTLLAAPRPLLNLAIFRKPTFSWAIILQMLFRFGTLLGFWIAPQYLIRVQGHRVDQLAALLEPMSLATLVSVPVAYFLTTRIDPRIVLSTGLACYAAAAWSCAGLTPEWSTANFWPAIITAGIGQGLFTVSTMRFAVFGVGREDGPTCGVVFNFARVFGLVGGLAVASHLINEREKYHSARIGEALGATDPLVAQRLASGAASLGSWVSDPAGAQRTALSSLSRAASNQAYVLGYSDAFTFTAVVMLAAALLVWALPALPPQTAPAPQSQG